MALERAEYEHYRVKLREFKAQCEQLGHTPLKKLSKTILNVVSMLTPDDVRQMRAVGCGDELEKVLWKLDMNFDEWYQKGYITEHGVLPKFRDKFNELQTALDEGLAAKDSSKTLNEMGTIEEL